MENQQKNRIKTAMIIYALEEALGNYVLDNEELIEDISSNTRDSIINREKERGNELSKNNIVKLVESSYLNEIFNFALDITKGTNYNDYLKDLKSYASLLNIFDIRNAVSHPNRLFPDCYWYKSASIASDPLIDKLGLTSVKQALNSAVAENLNPPPDEWINNVKWAIPNTLPTSFDHEITGLLGRDKEFKDLKNVLSKIRNNLIAVVAPGGVGKTSLILQFLKDISLTPEWSNKIDAISFCTLKNERLTADGIEKIEAINGMNQIKESILSDLNEMFGDEDYNDFDTACDQLGDKKILICIDNLETLLMDSQEEFIEFNQSLPIHWRVVVTSRVSVDSAITVPLDPLMKRHAINLCRNYFRKRGVSNFSQKDLEKIADMANNNPLAIRLSIDLFIKGVDISQSIEKSQKNIALFSYRNLIESLKEKSIIVLEAIFAIGDSTKSELIELLELTGEEIVESINELSKTSLIVRSLSEVGVDCYKLSESIRDLLLITPKNIEVRQQIKDKVKSRKFKIREQARRDQALGINKFDEQYIEPNTDNATNVIIVDLNRFLDKKNRNNQSLDTLNNIKQRFNDLIDHYPHSYQLHYHYSRVLRFLKDKQGEIQSLKSAQKYSADNYRIQLSISLNNFHEGNYEESEKLFEKLIELDLHNPNISNQKYSYSLNNCYLHNLLYLSKFDKILEFTKNWNEDENWLVLYGTHRATSYKRKAENFNIRNLNDCQELYLKSYVIFNEIFCKEGYIHITCTEAYKNIRNIQILINKGWQFSNSFLEKVLIFIDEHFIDIAGSLRNLSVDSNEVQDVLKTFYDIDSVTNPIKEANWYKPKTKLVYDKAHIEELKSLGFTIVTIYNIPQREYMPNYLFAKDKSENQYYLKVDDYEGGWNLWGYLELDNKLAIKYEKSRNPQKPNRAIEILNIDQFVI